MSLEREKRGRRPESFDAEAHAPQQEVVDISAARDALVIIDRIASAINRYNTLAKDEYIDALYANAILNDIHEGIDDAQILVNTFAPEAILRNLECGQAARRLFHIIDVMEPEFLAYFSTQWEQADADDDGEVVLDNSVYAYLNRDEKRLLRELRPSEDTQDRARDLYIEFAKAQQPGQSNGDLPVLPVHLAQYSAELMADMETVPVDRASIGIELQKILESIIDFDAVPGRLEVLQKVLQGLCMYAARMQAYTGDTKITRGVQEDIQRICDAYIKAYTKNRHEGLTYKYTEIQRYLPQMIETMAFYLQSHSGRFPIEE